MSTLVSLAGAVLASFILLICAFIYAIRTEKCCFARKGDFKPTDLDSQKLDIEKTATTGPGGIPADAIYTTAPRTGAGGVLMTGGGGGGPGRSPEAMKLSSIPTTMNNHHLNNLTTTSQPFNQNNYPHHQSQQRQRSTTPFVMETSAPAPTFRPLSSRYQPPPGQQLSHYQPPHPPPPSFYESDNTDDPELLQMTYPNLTPNTTYRSFNKYQPTPDKIRYVPNVITNNAANSRSLPGSKRYYSGSTKSNHHGSRPRPLQVDNDRYYDHIFPTYKTVSSDVPAGGVTSFKRHQGDRSSYNSVYYQPESYRDHAEL